MLKRRERQHGEPLVAAARVLDHTAEFIEYLYATGAPIPAVVQIAMRALAARRASP